MMFMVYIMLIILIVVSFFTVYKILQLPTIKNASEIVLKTKLFEIHIKK